MKLSLCFVILELTTLSPTTFFKANLNFFVKIDTNYIMTDTIYTFKGVICKYD